MAIELDYQEFCRMYVAVKYLSDQVDRLTEDNKRLNNNMLLLRKELEDVKKLDFYDILLKNN